jgi:hypothetical protein
MSTDVAGAEVSSKLQATKSERAARQAREARIRFWRVLAVSVFFATVLGANLYIGAVVVIGNLRSKVSSNVITSNGRTALVKRPMLDGVLCRKMIYDNQTSNTIDDKIERCDQAVVEKPKGKSKTQFSWGGY